MKRTTLMILFMVGHIWAQNGVPIISNLTTIVDSITHVVTFQYDLWDDENDSMLVSLKISDNNGETFLFEADSLTGDIGFPIFSGNGKQIQWKYRPDSSHVFKAKIVADDLFEIDISEIVAQVDSLNLIEHVAQLEGVRHRNTGFQNLQFAKQYIEDQFSNHGIQASRDAFSWQGYYAENIIGKHPGQKNEESVYIIDGHFDTVYQSPGADDNGTGVSGMLETMRVLSQYDFGSTIKFLGFDLEEEGLFGAINYVEECMPEYEYTEGVINLDMIGYTSNEANSQTFPSGFNMLFPELVEFAEADSNRANFIFNFANENSSPLMDSFVAAATTFTPDLRIGSATVPGNSEIAPDLRRSDHAPFWDAGIQALFITVGGEFRSPHYHMQSDTLGTINFDLVLDVVRTTVATIASLAEPMHCDALESETFEVGSSPVSIVNQSTPERFSLHQNFPNPFNPSTTLRYQLPEHMFVNIVVYDLLGNEIVTLVSEKQKAGNNSITWQGIDARGHQVSSGMYLYTINANQYTATRKMILLK